MSWKLRLGVSLLTLFARILFITQRFRFFGLREHEKYQARGKGVVYAFWHQRMIPFIWSHRDRGILVLISRHRDGEWIARSVARFGFQSIRGSTTRGGASALLQLYRTAKKSRVDIAFTPDGPRGPRFHMQSGAIYFAARTGMPIVLGASSMSRYIELRSWDRFRIPLPFGKIVVRTSEPIPVPRSVLSDPAELAACQSDLERRLRSLTDACDRQLRVPTTQSATEAEIARALRRRRRSL